MADRHADYYLRLGDQAAPHIVGTDDSTWTRRLEAEHDNPHASGGVMRGGVDDMLNDETP